MSQARDEVIRWSRLSPGRPDYDRFTEALDAYREEVLEQAAKYLARTGYSESAYLLRTSGVPEL